MCEASLCNSLNTDNAADTLILADLHSAEELKTMSIEYINRYMHPYSHYSPDLFI